MLNEIQKCTLCYFCSAKQYPGCRAKVILLIILCIILFRISCNFSAYAPNSMHYSQNYSQDYYQNTAITLEMTLCYNNLLLY